MLTRIELKNFMSHRHTVLEPAAGLTVLVGPNNCGKSALVAALQILCHNENSTYVMRHGERECSVEVQTSDGHTVRWTRKGSPSYLIDGERYDRLGQGRVPEPLHAALRLPEVDAGDDHSFDIHFGCQKSPIFLLDRPAAAAAKFFASSSDAIRLVEMQRRHREKHAEKQREKTRLEAESKEVNAQLDALQPAGTIDQQVKAAETTHHELVQLAALAGQLEIDAAGLEKRAVEAAYRAGQTGALSPLAPPPALAPVEPLIALRGQIEQCQKDCSLAVARHDALHSLPVPPPLDDAIPLARLVDDMQSQLQAIESGRNRREVLSPLASPPLLLATDELRLLVESMVSVSRSVEWEASRGDALQSLTLPAAPDDANALAQCLRGLCDATDAVKDLQNHRAALSQLPVPPLPAAVEPLMQLCAEMQNYANQIERLKMDAATLDAEQSRVVEELRDLAADATCPTCGAPLDADRLLSHAAAHGGPAHA